MNINGTPDLSDAIWHLKNDAQYTIGEDGLSSLVWLDENPTNITNSQIETKLAELETAYTNNAYGRNRANDYPSIADQLDKIYHSGLTEWKKVIKATKDKYPKD